MKIKFTIFCLLINLSSALAQVPTWSENIACIFYTRCTTCHHPNGIAPFSLVDYNDAYNKTLAIYNSVSNKEMPPWPADENFQTYAHERVLTQQEITLITDWVTGGAPVGNINNAPNPPVYTTNAQITNPSLSVSIPTYTIPSLSNDLYRCFVIQNVTSVDKYITGIEVLPGNLAAVHHVVVYADTSQVPVQLDNADPDPGYTSFGGTGSNTSELIGLWAPGGNPYFLPNGMGIKVKANSNIILQLHYPVSSSGMIDSTRVNFVLTSSPLTRNVTIAPVLNHSTSMTDGPLYIPADSVRTFHEQFTVPFNATVLSVAPHMHLIGRSIKSYAVTPWGDTIKFVDIPDWDFHWQTQYIFRQPVKVPSGSVMYAEALYDNTINNPYNPSFPPQDVWVGEATTDEMMLVFFGFTFYLNGDENIIVDTSTVVQTYNGCVFTATGFGEMLNSATMNLYPNPAENELHIQLPKGEMFVVDILDAGGRLVKRINESEEDLTLNIAQLGSGVYFIKARSPGKTFTEKLMVMPH